MTHQDKYTLTSQLIDDLVAKGLSGLPELIQVFLNVTLKSEQEQCLNACSYERSKKRCIYANGYKPKTDNALVSEITFDISQVRESGFYPSALEKGLRG